MLTFAEAEAGASVLDLQTLLISSGMVVAICGVSFIVNTVFGRNDAPGRLWSAAFIAGILATLSFALWGAQPSAWWAIAVGNASLVMAMGCVWSGARAFNRRSPRFPYVLIGVGAAALAVVVEGPNGGDWAGGLMFLLGVSVHATLAGFEALTGRMRRNLNARVLAILMLVVGIYYGIRATVFVLAGPDSQLFQEYMGTQVTTFITILFVILASMSMSILRSESSSARQTRAVEQTNWSVILPGGMFTPAVADRIRRAGLHGDRLAFIGAEIDNLTDMNTAFGRSFGDEAIVSFTSILHDHMPTTAILGHHAGAQFAAVVLADDLEQALGMINDVRAALVESPLTNSSGLRLSVSWGVVMVEPGETDLAALTAEVWRLVQQSREAGGNRVEFRPVDAAR